MSGKGIMERLKKDKRLALIVIVGLIGIFLLTLSEFMPKDEDKKEKSTDETAQQDFADYEEKIEKRLTSVIGSISGAGNVKVMVTIDSGSESIYATEQKLNKGEKSGTEEKSYVIVEKSGDGEGLLLKVVEPEIRGVAVICDGADSAAVRQEIIGTVTAVLGISSNRVNIAKMKKQ